MSGSGISWAVCKSAPCSRQITTPVPHHSVLQAGCPSCHPTNSVKALTAAAKLHIIHASCNKMIRDVNSAFSSDQSVLNFCSTATRSQRRRPTPSRPVYESFFSASTEVNETSPNHRGTRDTTSIPNISRRRRFATSSEGVPRATNRAIERTQDDARRQLQCLHLMSSYRQVSVSTLKTISRRRSVEKIQSAPLSECKLRMTRNYSFPIRQSNIDLLK